MILTFTKADFKSSIWYGTKIHTIREDKADRWHEGRTIQFWFGNPRNVKKNPHEFMKGLCKSVQKIEIDYQGLKQNGMVIPAVKIEGKYIDYHTKIILAVSDGFDSVHELFEWFNSDFTGKLIHWTDYKY